MLLWLAIALFSSVAIFKLRKMGSREDGLPPGPPTLPVVGNLHLFKSKPVYLQFTEWAKQYGGMYSLKMGSTTAIVLSDASVVKEFLEKRSATTSDRPVRHIIELVTGRLELGFSQYNDTWRTLRKAAHAILTQKATENHLPIQEAESTQLLHDILCTPQFFYQHVGRYSNSVILSVIYGTRAPQYSTPETLALFKVERRWTSFLDEGATPPIDRFPVLKFVPERWAKWKREAKEIRALRRELFFGLLERTEERLRKGQPNGSYAEEWLMRKEELGMDREQIGYLAGSLITGGSDTTSAYLTSLILALVAHPEVQKKAQEEIDRVVGQDRMPALEDLLGDQMPYIRALILESHRFRPIIPISHRAFSAPDQFRGHTFARDTIIHVNTWGMFHDPEIYDQPEKFIPERYLLTENGAKPGVEAVDVRPLNQIFGAGRRICPGMYLGQNSININVMNLLWAFDFKPAHEIKPDLSPSAYAKGLTMPPLPFKCSITPRTKDKAEMIRSEYLKAGAEFEKFEFGISPADREFVVKSRSK